MWNLEKKDDMRFEGRFLGAGVETEYPKKMPLECLAKKHHSISWRETFFQKANQ